MQSLTPLSSHDPACPPTVYEALMVANPLVQRWVCGEKGVGQALGHVVFQAISTEAEIIALFVVPRHRGQGHARAILQQLQGAYAHIHLDVRPSNAPAISLYQSLGFAQNGLRKAYYEDGEDALQMRWQQH